MIRYDVQSYYDVAGATYAFSPSTDAPVLNRKGWLTLQVFEAKANPNEVFDVCRFMTTPEGMT